MREGYFAAIIRAEDFRGSLISQNFGVYFSELRRQQRAVKEGVINRCQKTRMHTHTWLATSLLITAAK